MGQYVSSKMHHYQNDRQMQLKSVAKINMKYRYLVLYEFPCFTSLPCDVELLFHPQNFIQLNCCVPFDFELVSCTFINV